MYDASVSVSFSFRGENALAKSDAWNGMKECAVDQIKDGPLPLEILMHVVTFLLCIIPFGIRHAGSAHRVFGHLI